MLSVDGNWREPADADDETAHVRRLLANVAAFTSGGTYLNFSGQENSDAPALVEAAYGNNLRRLRELKRRCDPDNLFRLDNNISPA